MKNYKHFFIQYINNDLYGYLHETDDVENPEDGDIYLINKSDVHYFLKSELFKKVDDKYQIVNFDDMLSNIKFELYHPDGSIKKEGDNIIIQSFPKTMIFYDKDYTKKAFNKKAFNKIVDYVELNFSSNETAISKFKTFLENIKKEILENNK